MEPKNVEIMDVIQREEAREIAAKGNPPLDEEGIAVVMNAKRVSIDEPPTQQKQDPLR